MPVASAAKRIADAGGILMAMPSLSQRGGERVAVLLANGFVRAGIPTQIALMRSSGDAEHDLRKMLDPDVRIASAGAPIRSPGRKRLERIRGTAFIRRQIKFSRPAIVLGAVNSIGLATARARGRRSRRPLFALKLTNRLAPPGIGFLRKLFVHRRFKFIFGRFDLVLTLSEAERRSMADPFPHTHDLFRTVPNPYVTDEMLAEPATTGPSASRILTAGSMVRQKRFDILLRAFALSRHDEATLTILGDGPLRPELQRLAHSLGIADRVEMPGFTPDLVPWLRRSDLFVLSSDYEGLPAVVVEALACAVPVVTTDSFGSARELLAGLEGCAVEPIRNPARLASAIDGSLDATPDSEQLLEIARTYLTEDAINAHIKELGQLLAEETPRKIASR